MLTSEMSSSKRLQSLSSLQQVTNTGYYINSAKWTVALDNSIVFPVIIDK